MTSLLPRARSEIAPGAVHVPDWLPLDEQRRLVDACRAWARPPAPMHHTRTPGGGVMAVQTVCLGWHWSPYRYTRNAVDVDGAPVEPFPDWLGDLGRRALADTYGSDTYGSDADHRDAGDRDADGRDAGGPATAAGYDPDTALVNFYDAAARMGLHQDKDEVSDEPVVSLSIGDTCTFRFGNTDNRGHPYTDVELQGGDLFVFGGPSRFAFHGVTRIRPGTGDPATGLESGRLNITLRVTGLG
ncbi:MAG: alpha-ketoglutarate-dependent dioxygenase AlkB [Acidimicrobiales bacterium]|nr:alpha-ketoglutarate-dependent dioxygenase AlkB [Acidimicrobiales bacterium]